MFTVQDAPIASVAAQVPPAAPPGREKGAPPTTVNVPPAKAPVPVLVTVTVRAELVVPVAQLPNANVLGETLALSTGGKLNFTAPASTKLFVFLWVPKKSRPGAGAYVEALDGM